MGIDVAVGKTRGGGSGGTCVGVGVDVGVVVEAGVVVGIGAVVDISVGVGEGVGIGKGDPSVSTTSSVSKSMASRIYHRAGSTKPMWTEK